jgi:hypothetical protein
LGKDVEISTISARMINRMKERGIILHVGLHLDDIVAGMN